MLALDLGGTQLRTAVVLPDGTLLGRRAVRTPRLAADVVAACVEGLRNSLTAAREAGLPQEPAALGISAPGPLDPYGGILLDLPNLDHSLWNFPLAEAVGREAGVPAVMAVDTHVAALAEGDFGAAVGIADYVYMTVSTGVGGAIVSGGRLMRGADGLAGELGHLTIDVNGPLCGCGARGHLEALSSGTGIAKAAREAGLGELEARDVAAAEDAGDPVASEIMNRARRSFAAAAVTIVDVFNPTRLIVGGGIAYAQQDRLLEPARQAVRDYGYKRQAERVEIVLAQLGDDVGLIGALSLVRLARLGEDRNLNSDATTLGHLALSPRPLAPHDQKDEKDRVDDATT